MRASLRIIHVLAAVGLVTSVADAGAAQTSGPSCESFPVPLLEVRFTTTDDSGSTAGPYRGFSHEVPGRDGHFISDAVSELGGGYASRS